MKISLYSINFGTGDVWFPIIEDANDKNIEFISVNSKKVNLSDIEELEQCTDIIEDLLEEFYSTKPILSVFTNKYTHNTFDSVVELMESAYLAICKLISEFEDDEYDGEEYDDTEEDTVNTERKKLPNIESLVQLFLKENNVYTDDIETILYKYSDWVLNR